MLTPDLFKLHSAKLIDPTLTPEKRKELAVEVRDSIEVFHAQDYAAFLENFLPAFNTLLSSVTKPQDFDNVIHQTRAIILEVLTRLLHNEALRARFQDVFALAMDILRSDNEENAATAIHIMFDLHKIYRSQLGGQVQPFLDFVRHLYQSFSNTVKALILTGKTSQLPGQPPVRSIAKASHSFKMMTECPLLVMFVFQLYPNLIKTNIQHLLPLMLRVIEVEISPQAAAVATPTTYQDFIAAQVKTVSFLSYLLKQFPDCIKLDEISIPRSVVKLLQSCPAESVPIRKELLVAAKHILGSPFRQGFFSQIDLLLEQSILVGSGKGTGDGLRPLAYSFLAELVHCVRLNLSIAQLERIISIFSTNLHDPTFTYSLQTSAVRLLLNLIEGILKIDPGDLQRSTAARELLLRILETMVNKYVTLGAQVPRLLKLVEDLRDGGDPALSEKRLSEIPIGDPMKEISDFKSLLKTLTLGLKTLIWSAINVRVSHPPLAKSQASSPVQANNADKSGTGSSGDGAVAGRTGARAGLSERECEIVSRLLGSGSKCFRLYSQLERANSPPANSMDMAETSGDTARSSLKGPQDTQGDVMYPDLTFLGSAVSRYVIATPQEEKDAFEQFAHIFTVMDVRSFQDIFGLRMTDLFDHIVENPAALMIPQHFLANSNISKYFADILLNFLVDKISVFDVVITQTSSTLTREQKVVQTTLKLFKILFASVSLFPANEPVLRLHIGYIIKRCLQCAAKARNPQNYLQMLRALFKTLANGNGENKFELLYRDFMPHVEPLFSGLLDLYQGPSRLEHGDLIVELCLMIPARPSTIFPYLDLQIKPIVWALEGGRENVHYGLRTLEFWVDMLQPSYLETLIVHVEPRLTKSLYRLLRPPASASFGHATLRILGKLGSRARGGTRLEMPFKPKRVSSTAQEVCLRWIDGNEIALETDEIVHLSADAVIQSRSMGTSPVSTEHQVHAWQLLYSCLGLLLGICRSKGGNVANNGTPEILNSTWIISSAMDISRDSRNLDAQVQPLTNSLEASEQLVNKMLVALLGSTGFPDLEKAFMEMPDIPEELRRPKEAVFGVTRYFALITVHSRARAPRGKLASCSLPSTNSLQPLQPPELSPRLFMKAIVDVLSHEDKVLSRGGVSCFQEYLSALLDYCVVDSKHETSTAPAIDSNADVEMTEAIGSALQCDSMDLSEGKNSGNRKTALECEGDGMAETEGNQQRYGVQKTGGQLVSDSNRILNSEATRSNREKESGGQGEASMDTRPSRQEDAGRPSRGGDVLAACLYEAVELLCHCCYKPHWHSKWAGAYGLGAIVSKVPRVTLAASSFAPCHVLMIRALLFVLRDFTEGVEDEVVEHARDALYRLIRICFGTRMKPIASLSSLPEHVVKVLRDTTLRLAADLICDSTSAREAARDCLIILAESLNCDVVDILTPVKEQLLRPLGQRSIRQHQFPVQVGFIEALIFCLKLQRPVVSEELFTAPLRLFVLGDVISMSEDGTIERLTEADEGLRTKLIENKLIQTSVVKHLMRLRRQAVELLCSVALHCPEHLQKPANDELFRRIISSFFRNLQSKDSQIVDSAKRGLKQALAKHPKPKEVLQYNLRPILGNLADYKKLTIPYLQGLSRVLDLFSNWFNVNLGDKLLEHLQRWTEPEKLAQLKRWTPGTEARVGAAILDLFHLLPPAASMFLERIVVMVIRLEGVLAVAGPGVAHLGLRSAKAASTSPYREPLLRYCNHHAKEAAKYFLMNLDNELMRQIFFVMIRATESEPLRKDLMDNPKRLVSPPLLTLDGMGTKSLSVLTVINLLSKHDQKWLGREPELIAKVSAYWKVASSFSQLNHHSQPAIERVQEVKTIAEILIRYYKQFPNHITTLFELLTVFSARTICDFTFVKEFLSESITSPDLIGCRRAVLSKFLSEFQDKTLSQERKLHALQYIVTPMVTVHLSERRERQKGSQAAAKDLRPSGTEGIAKVSRSDSDPARSGDAERSKATTSSRENKEVPLGSGIENSGDAHRGSLNIQGPNGEKDPSVNRDLPSAIRKGKADDRDVGLLNIPDPVLDATIIQRIMKEVLDQPAEVLRNYDEPLSAELLRLATVLIRFMPVELNRYRKELIKFGWNHLKREDSIAKQWAFINVSRFFDAYNAPDKIILQVYVALLRACQSEGKDLVQQALDILTPALPRRLVHNPAEHKYPIWIRYTKKILLEEGHSIPNLVHIWHLITRHADLFFVARAQFVPLMVNSLSKIGLNASASPENRRLALDIVDLIIKWERLRRFKAHGTYEDGTNHAISSKNNPKKRPRDALMEKDSSHSSEKKSEGVQLKGSSAEPPAKQRKTGESQSLPLDSNVSRNNAPAGTREAEDFKPTAAMIDVLVNFLVQVPFRSMDRREGPLIIRRCISLLKGALELWPDATVRLSFIEKLLAMSVVEKPGTAPAASGGVKPVSNGQEATANESKNAVKPDAQRSDKEEQVRIKRSVARYAAVSTALALTTVLIKYQGRNFLEGNGAAIHALTKPAIMEGTIQTATQTTTQFAALLREMLLVYPLTVGTPAMNADRQVENLVKQAASSSGMTSKAKTDASGRSPNHKPHRTSATEKLSGADASRLVYSAVNGCIEACIKSSEPVRIHCGLLVLKVLSDAKPRGIVKFLDLLTKCVHRMTKENIQSSQQATGNSATSAPPTNSAPCPRPGTSDSNAPNPGGVGSGRAPTNGSTPGADASQLPDTGRARRTQASDESNLKKASPSSSQPLILGLSLLGKNISNLEQPQRKTLFQMLWVLIDRCGQVDVLLEIVRIVGDWVLWKGDTSDVIQKDPLTSREKVQFLLKMVVFERITEKESEMLKKSYLEIVLRVFQVQARRSEIASKLERAFMLGMKTEDSATRRQFFDIYDKSMSPSLPIRLHHIMSKQEWEFLSDTLWIKHAVDFLLAAVDQSMMLQCTNGQGSFPLVERGMNELPKGDNIRVLEELETEKGHKIFLGDVEVVVDHSLGRFWKSQQRLSVDNFMSPLRALLYHDPKVAYSVWVGLVPRVWSTMCPADRTIVEKSIPHLLTKEYHQIQTGWVRNNIQAFLDGFIRCSPLPAIRADLIYHLGSRWRAWHTALRYLEARENTLHAKYNVALADRDGKLCDKITAEREDIADVRIDLYELLHERDFVCGAWKSRSKFPLAVEALSFEQTGQYLQAQANYGAAMATQPPADGNNGFVPSDGDQKDQAVKDEGCFWEERWVDCARKLCQWEVLTEFARVVVNSELLHECLWRVPDWSALKELLIKNPVEDGPQLKLYQAYVQLQENKLDQADSFISQGYQRAMEKYWALPDSADLDACGPILVQFQQLVELQESGRILGELNALSRHGSGSINVEQKIDNVRLILNTWRERLPSPHESLTVWNDVLTWRNHVHAVVVNVLEALKEAASAKVAAAQNQVSGNVPGRAHSGNIPAQSPQVQAAAAIAQALPQQVLVMGINETAWNVHRFAKACRKQGHPVMALHALQKLYPFGTMELNEYFVKMKETARSYMVKPNFVRNSFECGLHELNRCNMVHFNARQKAQLFTLRSKLCAGLGKSDEAVEALSVALSTSSDVGSAWLCWGIHCDKMQRTFTTDTGSSNRCAEMKDSASPPSSDNGAVKLETAMTWREAAVNCYLQAARFGSRKSRLHFPRILRLVSTDVETRLERVAQQSSMSSPSTPGGQSNVLEELANVTKGVQAKSGYISDKDHIPSKQAIEQAINEGASKVLASLVPELPIWMWLPWLSQIVLMLARNEALVVKPILVRIAQQYPQAVFFPIRAYMEDRKLIDKPEKVLSKEAMKMGRPMTPAFLGSASPAQVAAARQVRIANEYATRAQQKFLSAQRARDRIEAAIAVCQSAAERAQNLAKKATLQEEMTTARRVLERATRDLRVAQERQKQLMEKATGAQLQQSALGPLENRVRVTEDRISDLMPKGKSEGPQLPGPADASRNLKGDLGGSNQEGTINPAEKVIGGNPNSSSSSSKEKNIASAVRSSPFAHADYIMAHIVKSHQLLYLDIERVAIELSFRLKPQREEHLLSLMNALLHRCYQYSVNIGKEVAPSFRSALEEVSKMCFGTGLHFKEGSHEQRLPPSIADLKAAFEADLAPQTAKDFPVEIETFIERLRRWQIIFQRRVEAMPDVQKLEIMSRHLLELNGSDVEVFGQYNDVEAVEPNVEKHIKIVRFSADVRTVKRLAGASRGIQILGTDGKAHEFILEASINSTIQATEDRTAQLMRFMNHVIFAKDSEAHRKRVQLTVPTFLSTGSRTRLVSDDSNYASLADGLEHYLRVRGKTLDEPIMAFRNYAAEAFGRRKSLSNEQAGRAESILARVDAYHNVCKSEIPDTCLLEWVNSRMPCAMSEFVFRKRLAETLAPACLVSYALAVGARRPQNVLFSWKTGAIYNQHMRGLVSNRGVLECDEAVPFRLTRNICRLLGRHGLEGPFYGSMATSLQALSRNVDLLKIFLDFVIRDEVINWTGARVEAIGKGIRSGTAGGEFHAIEDKLAASVAAVFHRLNDPDGALSNNEAGASDREKNKVMEFVMSLIEKARSPENLAQMEASWQCWF